MNNKELNFLKRHTQNVIGVLKEEYPDAKCALDFNSPFELMISCILAAQCTDLRVNMITPGLFEKYPTPFSFASADIEELEKDIFSTGFYRAKAKAIIGCSKHLIEKYEGIVPSDVVELTALPGVGRKTASVVAGNAFSIPAIAVDTHVKRLSNLLRWVDTQDQDKIEESLKQIVDENDWVVLSHLLATHGRNVCIARRPKCEKCAIEIYCPSSNQKVEK